MASNYFTRPKGLHPTPSACFPPPPPYEPPPIFHSIQFIPNPVLTNHAIDVLARFNNPEVGFFSDITYTLITPGCVQGLPIPLRNDVPADFQISSGNVPGNYEGIFFLEWVNGRKAIFKFPYTIN